MHAKIGNFMKAGLQHTPAAEEELSWKRRVGQSSAEAGMHKVAVALARQLPKRGCIMKISQQT